MSDAAAADEQKGDLLRLLPDRLLLLLLRLRPALGIRMSSNCTLL
jgi:hypothetical protein